MGIEDRRRHSGKDLLIPDRSISVVLGGAHFKETPHLEHLPDLPPVQYVAVGLAKPEELVAADFDAVTKAIAGDKEKETFKYIVVDQLARPGFRSVGDVFLVFSSQVQHLSMIEILAAARMLMGRNRSAGFMTRTEGDQGVSYNVHGNSRGLEGPLSLEASDRYRDGVLVPMLRGAGVKIQE